MIQNVLEDNDMDKAIVSKRTKLMIFDEFDICYSAANKVVKQVLKNGKDLDTISSKEVLRKDTKKLSICHKLWFSNPYIFSTQCKP